MTAPRHPHASHRASAAAAFFGQGLVFISLTTKLPAIQSRFDLSPASLSLLMLGLVLCAGLGSLLGEKVAPSRGSALTLRAGFTTMAVALPAMGLAPNVPLLGLAMAAYGVGLGLVDAGANMQGVAVEHEYGRPLMPSFHAAWTAGGILGTLGALVTHRLSFTASACGLAVVVLVLACLPYLRSAAVVVPIGDDGVSVPWKRILPVGAAMVLFYMVDTAATTWGPTYLDHVFHAHAGLVAVATLPYLVASLVGRGIGDRMAARLGGATLVRLGAFVGCVGLALVTFARGWGMALAGFFVVGVGIAVVAPLSFSAAATIARETFARSAGPGDEAPSPEAVRARVDAIIARFNQFNYAGALLGSVMTGAVGNDTLRVGFAVPMVLVLVIAPLARNFRTPADA